MNKKVILLASLDREYVDRVEASIVFALNEYTSLFIIDSPEYLKQYVETMHAEVEVLIADEAVFQDLHRVQPAGKSYKLTEGKTQDNLISKYDGESGILSCIGSEYLTSAIAEDEKTRIIDVVAVSGGSGKTMTALGIASQLSDMGKSVLYIDAQVLQNFYEYMPKSDGLKWGDENMALAFLRSPGEVKGAILGSITKGVFDYIPPFKEPLFVYNISLASYYNVAEFIAKQQIYDYIVVEHSLEMSKELVVHLSKSKCIIVCTDTSAQAPERINRFMKSIVDFKGQCLLVSDKRREHIDSRLFADPIIYKYPVCDSIQEARAHITTADFVAEGMFKAAAEAVR